MPRLQEGRLTFDFPDGGPDVAKYDEWSFFRNQFQTVCGGVTAVDFIFVETARTWLIEVKDYRHHRRTKVADLAGEVAAKVRDTLAGLAACRCNANDAMEQRIAARALSTRRLGNRPPFGTARYLIETATASRRSHRSDAEAETTPEADRSASTGCRSSLASPFDALDGDVAGSTS